VKDLCRKYGFSEASYYLWRSKFGGMSVSDAKRLKELEIENARLKKLLADALLENEVTREVLRKMYGPPPICKPFFRRRTGPRQCIRPVDGACPLLATMGRRAAPS
jgi:putative transposase